VQIAEKADCTRLNGFVYQELQSMKDSSPIAITLAAGMGLLIGAVDFVSPHFLPAVALSILGGGALGLRYPERYWKLAVLLGFCVPVAVVFGMASGHHPARGHFVLIDARAILLALLGATAATAVRLRILAQKRTV
jgi:hypothetical protein